MRTQWKFESDTRYFSAKAFNNSYLSQMYNWDRFVPFEVPSYPDKLDYLIGRAVHLFVLQPTIFHKLVYELKGDGRDAKVKKAKADFLKMKDENPEMIILKEADYESVISMGEKVLANSEAQDLLSGCAKEQSGYRGFKFKTGQIVFFKCKIDARKPTVIVDLKTTSASNKWEIQQAVDKYNYDMQSFNYLFQANSIEEFNETDIRYKDYWWIYITKDRHEVVCYQLSDSDRLIGQHKWETAFNILRQYYEQGTINTTLETPIWKEKKYQYFLR